MTTVNVDLAYNAGTQSSKDVALGPQDILVAKLTTPAVVKEGGQGGWVGTVEFKALPWDRVLCISTTPGDFTPNSITYTKPNGKPKTVTTNVSNGPDPSILFSDSPGLGFNLLPSTTYYVNMKTVAASAQDCDVRVTLTAGK